MKEKPRRGFYVILILLAVLVLVLVNVTIGYVGSIYSIPNTPLLLLYLVAFAFTFAFLYDYLSSRIKLDFKRRLVLVISLLMISAIGTQSIWFVSTPNWSFSVSTDKLVYKLGEEVRIKASLKNLGYIPHSIKFGLSDPVWITVEYGEYPNEGQGVWHSPFRMTTTEFLIGPSQSLDRSFTWNQTVAPEESLFFGNEVRLGNYVIQAFIPKAGATTPLDLTFDPLFLAVIRVTITS